MSWELFVSARYLVAKQREKFISLTGLISILGVAVGVAALIVVIGVMSGFDEELQNKIIGMNAHLVIVSDSPVPPAILKKLEKVVAASDFVSGQAIISNKKETTGVLLKGIDPANEGNVTKINEYLKVGTLPPDGGVLIGSELSKRFNLNIGDKVSFLSLGSTRPTELNVCGIFTSGMYEYDANFTITNIATAQNILGMDKSISGIALKVREPLKANEIKTNIQKTLGYPYFVRTWMDMNRNLFSAIKLEKITMFIILTLIVLVACFNIASTLIMMVTEKTRDIGILKSIGAPNTSIIAIFMLEGFLIGAVGALLGGAGGLWLGRLIGNYPIVKTLGLEEIYYFDRLPVKIDPADCIIVVGMALVISVIATVYPALKAGRLSPVEALRYE